MQKIKLLPFLVVTVVTLAACGSTNGSYGDGLRQLAGVASEVQSPPTPTPTATKTPDFGPSPTPTLAPSPTPVVIERLQVVTQTQTQPVYVFISDVEPCPVDARGRIDRACAAKWRRP